MASWGRVDPANAHRAAVDEGIVVHSGDPLNGETPLAALVEGDVTANPRFYIRNHFGIPDLDPSSWRLHVGGLVEKPVVLSLSELRDMPSQHLVATLECAGNGRAAFDPPVEGEQWRFGAVSAAEWNGVPLAEVLDRAAPKAGAREIVFRGADAGSRNDDGEAMRFERSLDVATARHCDALLAYEMNGEPLPAVHGFPLRLVVPGWYAMASVKWLTEIETVTEPCTGHYQTEAYFFETERDGSAVREPARLQRVRSLIVEPPPGAQVARGDLVLRGVAWSGAGRIARVEVSAGDGRWQAAGRARQTAPYGLCFWEAVVHIEDVGQTTVRVRATDETGATQPEAPPWNRLGYGNNAVHGVRIVVR